MCVFNSSIRSITKVVEYKNYLFGQSAIDVVKYMLGNRNRNCNTSVQKVLYRHGISST